MKKKSRRTNHWALSVLLALMLGVAGSTLGVPSPAAAVGTGDILPPFDIGQQWCIYRGYDYASHASTTTSRYGLDLVGSDCGTTSAAGLNVRAPISGNVYYYDAPYGNLCINVAGGRSYTLTHIAPSVTSGPVVAGSVVGVVAAAQPNASIAPRNNNVAHIHFQVWSAPNCYNNSTAPFDTAHNARICGAPDLYANGPAGNNGQWSGTLFTGATCGPPSPPPPPTAPWSSLSGDDNRADLLWYESWSTAISVLKTNPVTSPTGFISSSQWTSGYGTPTWAGVGDFNGDHRTDVIWYESWSTNITVMLTNSTSTGFASSATWTSGYGAPTFADVGDFNADGKADLLWYESWSTNISVLLTNSSATGFTASTWTSGYGAPTFAAVGYFDDDNRADLMWYEGWSTTISVLLTAHVTNPTGFVSSTAWTTGYGPPTFADVGDFNDDGRDDLLWYESWSTNITVLKTNSTSTGFASSTTWTSGYGAPTFAAVADMTGDGKADLLWYESWSTAISVLTTNSSANGFTSAEWTRGYAPPAFAALG